MEPRSPSPDRVKNKQREHWNAVAEGWATWLDWTERNFRPVTNWFHEAAGWKPGARVLDVAAGSGYPAFAAAACLRPGGTVVAIDISPAMTAAASRRATTAGLDNLEFLEMDAEDLRFENESFDAVTNAYGLMFCPDPQRAVSEAHRVLKPGGRVAFAAWDEPSKSPFLTLIGGVAAGFLSLPPPDPAAPGPFRLAERGTLERMLRAGGFSDVRVEICPATFECESVAEYRQIFTDLVWKARIDSLPAADSARFTEAIEGAARPFFEGDRLRLTATSLCASGRK